MINRIYPWFMSISFNIIAIYFQVMLSLFVLKVYIGVIMGNVLTLMPGVIV